jgi:hypothetical protein
MDLLEPQIHSFIIKIWLEGGAQQGVRPAWRGQITHVPGGEHCYLRGLGQIAQFIVPYLQESGIKPRMWWRFRQCLNRWKRYLKSVG